MIAMFLRIVATMGLFVGSGLAAADLADTIERVKPSIVAIGTYKSTNSPPFVMRGTGFVIGDGNLIATNAHVASAARPDADGTSLAVQVRWGGAGESQIRKGKILATDSEHDLALIRLEGPALPKLLLRHSDTVREGDSIAFTGFPIGAVLGFSPVTHRGIVSAITPIVIPSANAQQLNAVAIRRTKAGSFSILQLDATAYPGNSGSPVFNPDTGQVVGIVNMVFVKGSKESVLSQPSGIAYAIPSIHLQRLSQGEGVDFSH